MIDVISATAVLSRAQQLVVDRGWHPASVAPALGVYDAVSESLWGTGIEHITSDQFLVMQPVLDFFSDAIGKQSIADWELIRGRTPADVYEAFARAINAARWAEAA